MFTQAKSKSFFKIQGFLDFMIKEFQDNTLLAAKEYGEEVVNLVRNDFKKAMYWYDKETISKVHTNNLEIT